MTARPLLVSADSDLIDDIVRLASANAVEIHLATDPAATRGRWQLAPLVLVGSDCAISLAGSGLGRRADVVLVCRTPSAQDWMHAVGVGAEHVVALPDGERWLIDRLADCSEGAPRNGTVVAVVGAGAGSGASTFAAGLAAVGGSAGHRTVLIDADPGAGGIDVLVGAESVPGARWPDVAQTRGRLAAELFAEALPVWDGFSFLSWTREAAGPMGGEAFAAVLDASCRAFDLVVVDIPRQLDPAAELVLARASRTVVVQAARVRTTVAAALLLRELESRCGRVDLVVRALPRGLPVSSVGQALDRPVAARLPNVRALAAGADPARSPSGRDPFGRVCHQVLSTILPGRTR